MTGDQLRAVKEANPFRPFTIFLADGRSWRVPHRDYLSLSPSGRTAVVYQMNDACSIIDVMLVTELAIEGSPVPSGEGGT